MEELRQLLLQTDDEYLIGLCNKGTVKRAYKDLEEESPAADWKEDEVEVTLKDANCRIRAPLGESRCSCPSRSICRHLITAILYLKQLEKEGNGDDSLDNDSEGVGQELSTDSANGKHENTMNALEQELFAIPLEKLKRACKNKNYRSFIERIRAGEQPEIQGTTVLTVRFPWEEAVVKLLSPIEYSTCSCHSKELCSHKAQAVLAYRLSKKVDAKEKDKLLEQMEQLLEVEAEWDYEELAKAAESMKEILKLQLVTGLSRLSPEAEESMERLAVISHGVDLADYETGFREAAAEYRMCFERKAAFQTESLTDKLLSLYRRALLLERAKTQGQIRALAGTYRDTYRLVPGLHLTAIGARTFRSKTGYEGETYYFLDGEQRKWYTWTDARPTFYEGVRRRPLESTAQAAAPWGLNCSREQMLGLEFYLERAKATEEGRLSASQETKGEIIGNRNLGCKEIQHMVFWDYEKLITSFFQEKQDSNKEKLALVGARGIRKVSFDSVEQRFQMELLDPDGRCLMVAVKYSKEEKLTIRVLERLSERLKGQEEATLVFFGIPYIEQGELFLYPIEFFEGERFAQEVGEPESDTQGNIVANVPDRELIRGMERFLLEIRQVSADLFQCGLNSPQEETLHSLSRLAKESEELGLHRLGKELAFLAESLSGKRHQMEFDPEPILTAWIRLNDYLKISMEKTSLDGALANIKTKERETV